MLLTELIGVVDGEPAVEAAERIKADCKYFIKEWGSIPTPTYALYRGTENSWPNIQRKTRTTRTPIGMDTKTQQKLDDFFEEEFGHRYRSENALFATGNMKHTQVFGTEHVVFPKGQFTYLWSPEVNDLNYMLLKLSVDEIISNIHFIHNRSLNKVRDHEVMINVAEYYVIPIRIYKRSVYPLLIK